MLIEWSENLNYEKYIANWLVLSTSDVSKNYNQVKEKNIINKIFLFIRHFKKLNLLKVGSFKATTFLKYFENEI